MLTEKRKGKSLAHKQTTVPLWRQCSTRSELQMGVGVTLWVPRHFHLDHLPRWSHLVSFRPAGRCTPGMPTPWGEVFFFPLKDVCFSSCEVEWGEGETLRQGVKRKPHHWDEHSLLVWTHPAWGISLPFQLEDLGGHCGSEADAKLIRGHSRAFKGGLDTIFTL